MLPPPPSRPHRSPSPPRARRRGRGLALFLLLPAALGIPAAVTLVAARMTPLPGWWMADEADPPRGALCSVRDRRGTLIAVHRTAGEAYLPVRFDHVDPLLASATMAAEDRRFRRHPGIDPLAAARAAWQNLRAGHRVSGGSTLTQQLAKLHLNRAGLRRDLRSKLREAWWALVLDAHLPKDRILEAYWNQAPYGATVRGVGAAAQLYFGRSPERLAPGEAALLAALPRSPVRLDPRRDPEAARRARDRVLARMGLSGPDLAAARERPLELAAPPLEGARLAPHWLARVEAALPNAATVTLPLDSALQERTSAALQSALTVLSSRGADDAAAVVIHNATGEVRAWVGSPDWSDPAHGQVDATRARRQPGSALKPFTYALGFEGGLRPSSLLPDLPLEYGSGDDIFRPRNYSGEYHGPVRARAALANSWNAAAVALLSAVGPERLRLLLEAAGISTLRQPGTSYGVGLTLGDAEVTLADLTTAYACLARGGAWMPRVEVLEARDAGDSLLSGPRPLAGTDPDIGTNSGDAHRSSAAGSAGLETDSAPAAAQGTDTAPPAARRVLDSRTAFLVTSILADPLARARAFGFDGPFSFPFPVAIKTGTSNDWRDNWAFGYTGEWTVGVWVGRAGGSGMDRVSGTTGAILALREILCFLEEGRPNREFAEEFPPPPGVSRRTICALSGMAAGPDCPETLDDWFHAEDPVGPNCTWHHRYALDASSGALARPCTPIARVRRVLFTEPNLAGISGATQFPWNRDAFLAWCADRGWPAPPTEVAACACGNPACAPGTRTQVAERAGTADDGARRARRSNSAPGAGPDCRILRPADGTSYALDPSLPASQQQVGLEASAGGRPVRWQVDGRPVGVTGPGERLFWRLSPGSHRIRAETESGAPPRNWDEVRIVVDAPS
jgi:penicillin-binding protein 1C